MVEVNRPKFPLLIVVCGKHRIEISVVEGVEEIRPQLESDTFGQGEILR
jgi:hypothetical protein